MTAASRGWVVAPRGPIPKPVQEALRKRLKQHVAKKWAKAVRGLVVRFRGAYAYVDAFPAKRWYAPGTTRAERARIDAIPIQLCRLGYLGRSDRWEYAFFAYSSLRYQLSMSASGSFVTTPERAFDGSARVYLED
jgi:hypothetical protein